MVTQLRWGILGTGWIAETFVADLLATGHTVAAAGSRSQSSADAFAARFGIPLAFGSYDELVNSAEVDAIYVATPHPMHAEHTLLAVAAGKHVLVEKPFTLNAREAERVAEAAAERGVVVLEAMWTRFLPSMVKLRDVIAAGHIGDVRTVIASHELVLSDDPLHRINNLELGGGALLDLGIYPVSFAVDLLGLPTDVIASGSISATGVDREIGLILRHQNGEMSVLHSSLDTPGNNGATVIGTRGRIDIDPVWYNKSSHTVRDLEGTIIETYSDAGETRGMEYQALELETLVAEGRAESAILPLAESVGIMAVLDQARAQIGLRYPHE